MAHSSKFVLLWTQILLFLMILCFLVYLFIYSGETRFSLQRESLSLSLHSSHLILSKFHSRKTTLLHFKKLALRAGAIAQWVGRLPCIRLPGFSPQHHMWSPKTSGVIPEPRARSDSWVPKQIKSKSRGPALLFQTLVKFFSWSSSLPSSFHLRM